MKIYSEYVNLSDTLQNERAENERLNSYIHQIINEIEEKAPLLNRQKQEYEEALNTINNLTSQLEKSMIVNSFIYFTNEFNLNMFVSLFERTLKH